MIESEGRGEHGGGKKGLKGCYGGDVLRFWGGLQVVVVSRE
jgi:hypothetical protein